MHGTSSEWGGRDVLQHGLDWPVGMRLLHGRSLWAPTNPRPAHSPCPYMSTRQNHHELREWMYQGQLLGCLAAAHSLQLPMHPLCCPCSLSAFLLLPPCAAF